MPAAREAAEVDVLIAGAGPAGLSCAIECARRGLSATVVDQGPVVHSILRFPTDMVFFTTRERLELGGLPMTIARAKPTRAEALAYYRAVVRHFALDVRPYRRVTGIAGADGAFEVAAVDRFGCTSWMTARKVVLATGYFDHPNRLRVPGEDLPHVRHGFRDAHEAFGRDVVIAGGGNSAAEAALESFRAGARVTLVVRAKDVHRSVKYWVGPDLRNRIAEGAIAVRFGTRIAAIGERDVLVRGAGGTGGVEERLAAGQVYVLIGFRPDVDLLRACGVAVDEATAKPAHDPETFETNVPGIHLAGSVVAGLDTSDVFIENGRLHAHAVARQLARALGRDPDPAGSGPPRAPLSHPGE